MPMMMLAATHLMKNDRITKSVRTMKIIKLYDDDTNNNANVRHHQRHNNSIIDRRICPHSLI